MPKIILFNGPPSSGKDVAARHCARLFPLGKQMEFKAPLTETALALTGIDREEWEACYNNREDKEASNKETPLKILNGLSQRQLLIKISEEWAKPTFGVRHFGEVAARNVSTEVENGVELFFFSDSGFIEEVEPLQEAFGKENLALIRLWRAGKSFKGDSRTYLPLDTFDWACDIINTGTIDSFKNDVTMAVKAFLGAK